MWKRLTIGIISLSLLGGCSGLSYALENYKGTKPVAFYQDEQKFRIFDKPLEGRLMITPSIGAAAAQGASLGTSSTPEMKYQTAAQAFLKSTGRNCDVGDMRLIIEPQWETFYTCE